MSPFSTKDLMEGHHGRREDLLARVVCIGSSSSLLGAYYSSDGGGVFATGSAVPLGVTCFSGSGDGGRRIYDVPVPPTYLKEHSATHLVIQIGDRSSRGLRGSGKGDIAATFSTITVELKSLHRLRRRPADITRRLEVVTTAWDRHTRKDGKHSRSAVAWLVKRSKHSNTPPTILIYDKPDLSNLMRDIPDETSWADLALAGTHDSTAFYGAPYAQCQTRGTSITEQLMDGIRFLDLRMRVEDDDLIMYHGYISQRARFADVLSEIYTFLLTHPSESMVVSIKEEVPPNHPDFAHMVWQAIQPRPSSWLTSSGGRARPTIKFATPTEHLPSYHRAQWRKHSQHAASPAGNGDAEKVELDGREEKKGNPFWFLDTHVPTVGEVRGKAILLCRFPQGEQWGEGIGWHPSWPDNRREGFEWEMDDGTLFRVQDWYDVPNPWSIQEKFEAVTSELVPTLTSLSLHAPLSPTSFPSMPYPYPYPQPTAPHLTPSLDSTPRRALTISYASGGRIPLAPPSTIASGLGWPSWGLGTYGVNHRLIDWLVDLIAFDSVDPERSPDTDADDGHGEREKGQVVGEGDEALTGMRRVRGIVPLDFYRDADGGSAVVELLAVMNESGLDVGMGRGDTG